MIFKRILILKRTTTLWKPITIIAKMKKGINKKLKFQMK